MLPMLFLAAIAHLVLFHDRNSSKALFCDVFASSRISYCCYGETIMESRRNLIFCAAMAHIVLLNSKQSSVISLWRLRMRLRSQMLKFIDGTVVFTVVFSSSLPHLALLFGEYFESVVKPKIKS